MLNRQKALIGAALAVPAAATAAQSDDAMYEAYYEAQRASLRCVTVAYFPRWADAGDYERDFARTQARATLNTLGLLSPKGTVR